MFGLFKSLLSSRRKQGKFASPQEEPQFVAIHRDDPEMRRAHRQAAATIGHFRVLVERGGEGLYSAKLRFRDPDESERLGEDRFVYLWLGFVVFHAEEKLFSGVFFEVPEALTKWHKLGDRLAFEAEDVFDWMVNDDGRLQGGFTLRVTRSRLPDSERQGFDEFTGVTVWEAVEDL